MQLTLYNYLPNQPSDANPGILAREVWQKNSCPLKKSVFSIVFAKNSRAENFRPPKTSAPVKYDAANAYK